jgi:hypothetical protein
VKQYSLYVISGFRLDADEICALLGCYTASSGNALPMFRDNVSVPFPGSRSPMKQLHWTSCHLKTVSIRCPETSEKDHHSALLNTPEERRSQYSVSSCPVPEAYKSDYFCNLNALQNSVACAV